MRLERAGLSLTLSRLLDVSVVIVFHCCGFEQPLDPEDTLSRNNNSLSSFTILLVARESSMRLPAPQKLIDFGKNFWYREREREREIQRNGLHNFAQTRDEICIAIAIELLGNLT